MKREHTARRLAGPGPELEQAARLDAGGGSRDDVLELLVRRNLAAHELEVAVRLEVELAHRSTRSAPRNDASPSSASSTPSSVAPGSGHMPLTRRTCPRRS